jgi:hypothetical protein
MAVQTSKKQNYGVGRKKTSIGRNNIKRSSMNKSRKRGYKKYRGQG